MKKGILLASILFITCSAFAQDDYGGTGFFTRVINGEGWLRPGANGVGKVTPSGVKVNAIKVNMTALGVSTLGIQYERGVSEKFSFAIQGRYHLDVPYEATVIDPVLDALNDFSDSVSIGAPSLTGYAITPEFRWYPKQTMRGFYLGPYFRYRALDFNIPFSYYDELGNYVTDIDGFVGENSTIIFGLVIGVHFEIVKRISLDIWVGGVQYGSTSGDVVFNAPVPLTASEVANIRSGIEDVEETLGIEFNEFVGTSGATLETRFGLPGVRLGGLNLGFRF